MREALFRYAPYLILLGLAVVLVSAGLVTFLTTPREVESVSLPTAVGAPQNASLQSGLSSVLPANRPRTLRSRNPANTHEVAIVGEFGNGGVWSWDDIVNLLGVYGSYGAFQTATVNGQQLEGVPLSYLLAYAQMNSYAYTIVMTNREPASTDYPAAALASCADCLIALTPDDTLVVSLPGFEPSVITGLYRIEAFVEGATFTNMSARPMNTQAVRLTGKFEHGGDWLWSDIVNLLGVYGSYNDFVQVTVGGQTYSGVPVSYLLDYAGIDPQSNIVDIYTRSDDRVSTTRVTLNGCADCIISLQPDRTLSLVMPGRRTELIPQIAVIDVR